MARVRTVLVVSVLAAAMLSGCTTVVGRPTTPLLAKREEPGVVLCQSERAGGGIRIIGKLNQGIYPITRATLEYRVADVSDPAPTISQGGALLLATPRSTKVNYRKGADEVVYTVDAAAARGLRGKVIWYRWIITYDRSGSERVDVTDVHRTSLEEAGLPRAAGNPGPDSSIASPTVRRR